MRRKADAISRQEFEQSAQFRDESLKLKMQRERIIGEHENQPFDNHLSIEALRRAIEPIAAP